MRMNRRVKGGLILLGTLLLVAAIFCPVSSCQMLWHGWAVECVFLTGEGNFWYVPPAEHSREPLMVLIEGDQDHTPWYIWPLRVVCEVG